MKKVITAFSLALLSHMTLLAMPSTTITTPPIKTLSAFCTEYIRTMLNDSEVSMGVKDEKNGFYAFCTLEEGDTECSMSSIQVEIAMWKKADGTAIFGVTHYFCGGEGCWNEGIDLRFYNDKMKDITTDLVYIDDAKSLGENKNLTAPDSNEVLGVEFDSQRMYLVGIPRKGTTISLQVGVPGIAQATFAEYVFDKKAGTFSLMSK